MSVLSQTWPSVLHTLNTIPVVEKGFSRDVEVIALGKKKKKQKLHILKQEISPNVFCQNSSDTVSNMKPCKIHITDSYKYCCWFISSVSSDSHLGAILIFRCFFSFPPPPPLLLLTKWSYNRQQLSLGIKKWLAIESRGWNEEAGWKPA